MRNQISASVGRAGKNRSSDVDTILHLVNLNRRRTGLVPLDQFNIKKKLKDKVAERSRHDTWLETFYSAIEEYQSSALGEDPPTGTIEPHSLAIAQLKGSLGTYKQSKKYTEPEWLAIASGELGVHEFSGLEQNNPRIVEYLKTVSYLDKKVKNYVEKGVSSSHVMSSVDETAWCACFVKWCLLQANKTTAKRMPATAESWQHFGRETNPCLGAITIIHRTPFQDTSSGWHVGFYIGGPPDAPALLGGNQGNRVGFSQFFDLDTTVYRWPDD